MNLVRRQLPKAIPTLIESNTAHSDRFVLEQLSDLLKSRPWISFMASNDLKMDMNLQVQIQHSVSKKKKVLAEHLFVGENILIDQ